MADFVVDDALLGQVETTLNNLKSEFENIQAQQNGYFGDWGSGDIASAMSDFAGNWDYHRGKMLESMGALCSSVHEVRSQTTQFDNKLKSELTKK